MNPRAQLSKGFCAPKDKLPGEAGGGLVCTSIAGHGGSGLCYLPPSLSLFWELALLAASPSLPASPWC